MVLVEADDLVDDLDAGVAAALGLPVPRGGRISHENRVIGKVERVIWYAANPHLIFSGFPPRSVMKSIMSSILAP